MSFTRIMLVVVALAGATCAQAAESLRYRARRRHRRRSPAGTSTSIATATTCRREAAASGMAMRYSISNARPVTAARARAASATSWSAARAHWRSPKPIRTVGSYWPYAPTLFDYIRRAMPQNAPQSLSNDDVYAVSAYILNLNGLLPADATLDAGDAECDQNAEPRQVRRRPASGRQESGCMTNCGGSK